jgi:hypothetical protein
MSSKAHNSVSSTQKVRVIFPDVLNACIENQVDNDQSSNDYNEMISNVFFDLANAAEVVYRVQNEIVKKDNAGTYLTFQQDMSACSRHTGGIVWETSYLLLEYLLEQCNSNNIILGRTLELGSGVGFLGQCLVAEQSPCKPDMVLTETEEVMTNLKRNIDRNRTPLCSNLNCKVSVCTLDWTRYEENIAISPDVLHPHSFDTLLGTDIIFTEHLVEPLLKTAARLSHSGTIWYLCVQIRCAKAHQTFLNQAPKYGFYVSDISCESYKSFHRKLSWGKTLECFLFRITRIPSEIKY